jgi:EmrB/QacA subfamily drug resistance transporter
VHDAPAPRTSSRTAWTAVLVCAGGALTALDLKIVNVALPQIAAELATDLTGLQWVVNAYTLAFASAILTAGAFSDRLGGWPIFSAGVVTFTAASLGCGLAPTTGVLVLARTVQGLGAAMILATSIALLARAYAGPGRATAIAAYVTVGTAAANLGPLIGGAIVDTLGWRGVFLVNLPVGLAILAALRAGGYGRSAEPAPPTGRRLDLTGAALAAIALFGASYALLTGSARGWGRPDVLACAAGSVLALAAFVLVQHHKGERALFDLRLFAVPSFSGAIAMSFLIRVVSFGALPFFVIWLEGMLGYSATGTGLRLLAMSVPVLLVATVSARIQRHLSARTMIALGNAAIAAGALLLLQIGVDRPWTVAVPGFVLIGLGSGLAFPPLLGTAVGVVSPDRAGMASGMANTFFPVGTAVGVAVFGALSTAAVDAAGLTGPARDAAVAGRFDQLPAQLLEPARHAVVDGLHLIAVSMATLSALAAVIALATIRERDRADSAA